MNNPTYAIQDLNVMFMMLDDKYESLIYWQCTCIDLRVYRMCVIRDDKKFIVKKIEVYDDKEIEQTLELFQEFLNYDF